MDRDELIALKEDFSILINDAEAYRSTLADYHNKHMLSNDMFSYGSLTNTNWNEAQFVLQHVHDAIQTYHSYVTKFNSEFSAKLDPIKKVQRQGSTTLAIVVIESIEDLIKVKQNSTKAIAILKGRLETISDTGTVPKPLTYNQQREQDPDWKPLYSKPEFTSRDKLSKDECMILARIMSPRSFILSPVGDTRETPETIQITNADSQHILEHRFSAQEDGANRWYKGFVSERRRILGHITFAAGTTMPIALIMFDGKFNNHAEKYEADPITHVKFEEIPMKASENRIHEAISLSKTSLKQTESDYFLNKAITLSGEAIRAWYIDPELSFLSAWRSVETIAKRDFKNEQAANGVSANDINNTWNAGRGIAKKYITKVLTDSKLTLEIGNIDNYQKLRNYIGHGSVDVKSTEKEIFYDESLKYSDISSNCYNVIKLSRALINKFL